MSLKGSKTPTLRGRTKYQIPNTKYQIPNTKYKILDAGCGTGNYSIALAQRGFNVVGIDSSPAMLKRAEAKKRKSKLQNVEFKQCDIEKGLPFFPDNTFDCILSIHALYTLKNPENALREYYRILRPSGHFILVEPRHPFRLMPVLKEASEHGGVIYLLKVFMSLFGVGICNLAIGKRQDKDAYHYYDEATLRKELASPGFRSNSIIPCYTNNWSSFGSTLKSSYEFETNGYRFLKVDTEEDLQKSYEIRHKIYCEKFGYLPITENKFETDKYDKHATHFICLDRSGIEIGTIRFIPQNVDGLPIEHGGFALTDYMKANSISIAAEVSRFAVYHTPSSRNSAIVPVGLFKCIHDCAKQAQINNLFAIVALDEVNKYKRIGFKEIGNPFNYSTALKGLWVPLHMDIQKTFENHSAGSTELNNKELAFIVGDSKQDHL